jgi:hypothetical protein
MKLPTATASDPPIDPTTTIISLGTKELRLFLEGESAAAAAAATPAPADRLLASNSSSGNLLATGTTPAGGSGTQTPL